MLDWLHEQTQARLLWWGSRSRTGQSVQVRVVRRCGAEKGDRVDWPLVGTGDGVKGSLMVRRIHTVLIFLAAAIVLSACGGGGSSDAVTSTGPIKIWYSDNPLFFN